MNRKRVKLLLAAFMAATALFCLLLNAPLPSPTSPLGHTSRAGPPPGARVEKRVSETRIDVTSLSRKDLPTASPTGDAPGEASSVVEAEATKAPPEPPVPLAEVSTRASPPQPRAPDPPIATAGTRPEVAEDSEPELAEARTLPTRAPPRFMPPDVEEPPERPRGPRARRPASRQPPGDAGTRVRTLDDDVSALEKLLAAGEGAPTIRIDRAPSEKAKTDLVTELERLFLSTATARVRRAEPDAARVEPELDSRATAVSPRTTPRTVAEWQARREHYRALSRQEDSARVSAVFRLERQDPETFRAVMVQYRMDILLEIPARGTYSIVPHGGDYWDRTEFRKGQDDLRIRYGLSVRDLSFPWLRTLRETHVATKLVSTEAVHVAVLVPRPETELLLGSIVAGCRSLGHSLEEVSACYGTFVERELSGRRLFDYEVTRLILKDGTLVKARGT